MDLFCFVLIPTYNTTLWAVYEIMVMIILRSESKKDEIFLILLRREKKEEVVTISIGNIIIGVGLFYFYFPFCMFYSLCLGWC